MSDETTTEQPMTPGRLAEIDIAIDMFRQTHPGTFGEMVSELRTELDRITNRFAELEDLGIEAYAEQLLAKARIRSMEIRDGSFSMDLDQAEEIAATYVAMARTMLGDAENYVEKQIGFPTAKTEHTVKIAESPADWYVLTVQRKWKLTPHEARKRAEAERDEARRIARVLRALHNIEAPDPDEPQGADWRIEGALDLDKLPDWLTAVPAAAEPTL